MSQLFRFTIRCLFWAMLILFGAVLFSIVFVLVCDGIDPKIRDVVLGFLEFIVFISLFLAAFIFMVLVFLKIRRQRLILALIQTALESETPIYEVLRSYASMCWGPWYRAKLFRFADKIQEGHSIVETAATVKGIIRYDTVGLIRLGGTKLPDKLFTQTTGNVYQSGLVHEQALFRFLWYYWSLPFLFFPAVFYLVAITPKMQVIYKDFGIPLPAVTLFVINLSRTAMVDYWYLFLLLLSILVLAPIFYFNFRSGIIPWRPLGVRRILRQRDSAQFLRILAAGLELQKPIEEIIDVYSQVVPSRYLRRLGHYFNTQIAQGINWIETLRKMCWVSRSEAALLESAVRTDHVEAMLREVADGKEQQQRTSDIVQIHLFSILYVVLFGIYVAVMALSLFMCLINLITTLTNF
ncbi:MAG: type II secretion system F family protein [Planctomycetaceae bacterium]|nr:type II secretion system F family protein [Planctomycetaceae bacterium]